MGDGTAVSKTGAENRRFESISLHQRVCREPRDSISTPHAATTSILRLDGPNNSRAYRVADSGARRSSACWRPGLRSNRAPHGVRSLTAMLAPCARTISMTIASPSPAPSPRAPLPRQKRSKMRGRSFRGIPGPLSRTPSASSYRPRGSVEGGTGIAGRSPIPDPPSERVGPSWRRGPANSRLRLSNSSSVGRCLAPAGAWPTGTGRPPAASKLF
jgi:hypothetical protein